jgi:murein DD-endopeptidase MepM/ murein hydrolase activator NlpD
VAAPGTPGWQAQLLRGVGAPITPENLKYVDSWQRAEGGSAANNPFNTTQPGFGETGNYNSVHVKQYGTAQGGVEATIHTLLNGRYGNILGALRSGKSAMADAQALAASPWGTGALVEKILGGNSSAAGGGGSPASSVTAPEAPGAPASVNAGGSPSRQRLAQLVFGQGGVDFNSNQVQVPNLMALAQARAQSGTAAITAAGKNYGPARDGAPTTSITRAGSPVVDLTSTSSAHPTEGLAGYPAHDYFAPSGSRADSPVSGKVVRLSGHDPAQGPIEGPHGPLGWSVYIQGNDGHTYYLTHMGSRSVQVGQTVKAGQPIGTVADYAHYGTPSHIHMGVH